jgi:peptidoglycan/LPS O-acetylase OafA/YrhL
MKKNYRPEIDGLRAFAVLGVILYHANITFSGIQPFKGGFIGVDIFFVISGYLISSIILNELTTTGSFSFKYFYERRIRRIIPVLLFVMISSIPFAWMYLMPENLIDYSYSQLSSLGFGSNFYFWDIGQKYGAMNGLLKPFLHTWSLSVEEQFYIFFPLTLLIVLKYCRKYLIQVLIFNFIFSLILAEWTSRNYPSISFYFIHTRVWELMAGSILAYLEITFGRENKNKFFCYSFPIIGFLLILHSFFFFNDQMLHPSIYTLSPIVGTSLIIWFSNKDEIITKILSLKIIVGIGLISYSLYLWHYPIFAFARISNLIQGEIYNKLLLGMTILILYIISYKYIEQPFRNKKIDFKKILIFLISFLCLLVIVNIKFITSNGYENRFNKIYKKNNLNRNILDKKSWYFINQLPQKFLSKNTTKVLIVGDSHSKDLFNIFYQNPNLYKKFEFLRYGKENEELSFDKTYEKNFIKFKNSQLLKDADVILISDKMNLDQLKNLEKFIIYFKNKKHIIISSLSNLYKDGLVYKRFTNLTLFDYLLIKQNDLGYLKLKSNIDVNISLKNQILINEVYFNLRKKIDLKIINNELEKLAKKNNLKFLLKDNFQCNFYNQICYGITDTGYKIYYDESHYTLEGSKYLGKIAHSINWFRLE